MNQRTTQGHNGSGDHSQVRAIGQRHQLDIYVIRHCANCAYAAEIAELIRREFPAVAVRLIDLADLQEPAPESVFATPTYLLDGHLWSLGNPSPQQVHALFSTLE